MMYIQSNITKWETDVSCSSYKSNFIYYESVQGFEISGGESMLLAGACIAYMYITSDLKFQLANHMDIFLFNILWCSGTWIIPH